MNFAFFKGEFASSVDFANLTPTKTGITQSFDFKQFDEKENFVVIWEAYLNVPTDGIYEFQMESAGGAVLMIDDEKIIALDDLRTKRNVSGDVPLRAGFHHFNLKYFQTTGESVLNLRWGIKGTALRRISINELYH